MLNRSRFAMLARGVLNRLSATWRNSGQAKNQKALTVVVLFGTTRAAGKLNFSTVLGSLLPQEVY